MLHLDLIPEVIDGGVEPNWVDWTGDWQNLEVIHRGPDNNLYLIDEGWRKLTLRVSNRASKTAEDLEDDWRINRYLLARDYPVAPILKLSKLDDEHLAAVYLYVPGQDLEIKAGADLNLRIVKEAAELLAKLHLLSLKEQAPMPKRAVLHKMLNEAGGTLEQRQTLQAWAKIKQKGWQIEKTKQSSVSYGRIARDSQNIFGSGVLTPVEKILIDQEKFRRYYFDAHKFLRAAELVLGGAFANQSETCLIHNDWRPNNMVLNSRGKIEVVLDFDYADEGPRLRDLAAALINWSFPDGQSEPWVRVFYAFVNAYQQTIGLTRRIDQDKLRWWLQLSCLIEAAVQYNQAFNQAFYRVGSIEESSAWQKYLYFAGAPGSQMG